MSFKSLAGKFQEKIRYFQKIDQKKSLIIDALATYLHIQGFPAVHTVYEYEDDSIIIQTSSKVFANELTLRLHEIVKLLKDEGITVKKIIIK